MMRYDNKRYAAFPFSLLLSLLAIAPLHTQKAQAASTKQERTQTVQSTKEEETNPQVKAEEKGSWTYFMRSLAWVSARVALVVVIGAIIGGIIGASMDSKNRTGGLFFGGLVGAVFGFFWGLPVACSVMVTME